MHHDYDQDLTVGQKHIFPVEKSLIAKTLGSNKLKL